MIYHWTYENVDQTSIDQLYKELKVNRVLCELLVKRGIKSFEEAKTYFRGSLTELHSPFSMMGMDTAVERINEAVKNKEKILFYGDYDVDGTTAVSLCYLFFRQFYEHIDYYIPDRHSEGYGISEQGIDYATEKHCALMIALDCGIKAIGPINYANEKGIDVIVCDHHTPGEQLPPALAILNPKQNNCKYPYKELSGCGIGFKLCEGYAEKNFIKKEKLYSFLDLLCISIASDIVPLTGENRILAKFGLLQLNTKPSPGVAAMISLIQLEKAYTISDVVFKLGPRINAAGRMAHAKAAVEVLIGQTDSAVLQVKNEERQSLDQSITAGALEQLELDENKNSVTNVVFNPSWHKGVVGIVASRIIEHIYKPTIVLCESNGELTGSARSVKGFNVYEPLKACEELMSKFGGHAFAAGLSLPKENLEAFKQKFDDEVRKRILPDDLIPKIAIDAQLKLSDVSDSFYHILQQFAPFGPENMRPVFETKRLADTGYSKIVGDNHLKLSLRDTEGNRINGIAFRMGDKLSLLQRGAIDICYVLEENLWNGKTSLEIIAKDIKASE
mgnify:CR=1 FL=1